jgi:hypothetical protein
VQRADHAYGDLARFATSTRENIGLDGRGRGRARARTAAAVLDRLRVLDVDRAHDAVDLAFSSLKSFIASRMQSVWPP